MIYLVNMTAYLDLHLSQTDKMNVNFFFSLYPHLFIVYNVGLKCWHHINKNTCLLSNFLTAHLNRNGGNTGAFWPEDHFSLLWAAHFTRTIVASSNELTYCRNTMYYIWLFCLKTVYSFHILQGPWVAHKDVQQGKQPQTIFLQINLDKLPGELVSQQKC